MLMARIAHAGGSWAALVRQPFMLWRVQDTCAISACIMCMEALHRIAYEKINGPGSFGLKVKPGTDEELKLKLKTIGPAAYVEEVLDAIGSIEGLPTDDDDNVRLTFRGYDARYCTVVAQDAAAMIAQGPVVGGMCYGNSKEAYSKLCEDGNTYLGPKVDDVPIPHAVVCVGYEFDHKAGLCIQILDNHKAEGPVRWVHYDAFHLFTVITVDAINPTAALPTL